MSEISEELKSQVLLALSKVMDPDLGKDIVSLGFIKNLEFDSGVLSYDLELTTPACPVKEDLKKQCEDLTLNLSGVEKVDVTLTAQEKKSPLTNQNQENLKGIRSIIGVSSCKGGVGKSTVALNLAMSLQQEGAVVGILDADIYGPSMPTMLGLPSGIQPLVEGNQIIPIERYGVKMMSAGLLMPEGQAAVLRGPMVANMFQQLLFQTRWGELDYLIIDMPPGTGDVQLTMSQVVPLTGAVIVTTPQKISLIDVSKGIAMFSQVNVPILGVVENMSYMKHPDSDEKIYLYGPSGAPRLAKTYGLDVLGEIPFYTEIVTNSDKGVPVALDSDADARPYYLEMSSKVVRSAAVASLDNLKCLTVDITW